METKESPSINKLLQPCKMARSIPVRAAMDSPLFTSVESNFLVNAEMMSPDVLLRTAAVTEK